MQSYAVIPLNLISSDLTGAELKVMCALYSFADVKKGDFVVWPSLDSIADRAGYRDPTSVSKLISKLCKKGWLTKKKRGYTGGNIYSLKAIEAPAKLVEPTNLEEMTNLAEPANMVETANLVEPAKNAEIKGLEVVETTNLAKPANLVKPAKTNLAEPAKNKEQTNEQTNINIICAEPEGSTPEIEILLPTNKFNTKGEEFPVLVSQVQDFQETYPGVDVSQTLKRIKSWCTTNPAKRKTKSGMLRFIDAWLAKEQNNSTRNGGANHAAGKSSCRPSFTERQAELTDAVTNYERATNF